MDTHVLNLCRYDYSGYGQSTGKVNFGFLISYTIFVLLIPGKKIDFGFLSQL